jgi:hypothetical protein
LHGVDVGADAAEPDTPSPKASATRPARTVALIRDMNLETMVFPPTPLPMPGELDPQVQLALFPVVHILECQRERGGKAGGWLGVTGLGGLTKIVHLPLLHVIVLGWPLSFTFTFVP